MSKTHLTQADTVHMGAAYYAAAYATQGRKGRPINPATRAVLGTPVVGDPNGVIETQNITAAGGPATGFDGTLADSLTLATFDVPRNVVAAWTTTAVMTVTGTDLYGEVIVESSASGTTMAGKKAFKTITDVSISTDVTAATVGHGDVLGLPYRVNNKDEILIFENGVPVATGTFVAAVTTDPATATTGDVRGTLDPTATLDGSIRIVVECLGLDAASKAGLFGVDQFGG